jgi:hypothetical protein
VDRGREYGTTDEPAAGVRDMGQDRISSGQRPSMALVAPDPPHLRSQERSGVCSVSVGEVEDEVLHLRSEPGPCRGLDRCASCGGNRLSVQLEQVVCRAWGHTGRG